MRVMELKSSRGITLKISLPSKKNRRFSGKKRLASGQVQYHIIGLHRPKIWIDGPGKLSCRRWFPSEIRTNAHIGIVVNLILGR